MRAIDMHVHVPRQPGLPEMEVEAGLRSYFRLRDAPEDADEMAAMYREWDILGVILSVDTETTTGEPPDTNDYVAGIVQKFPEQFIGFATIDPWKGESRCSGAGPLDHRAGTQGPEAAPHPPGVLPKRHPLLPPL